jgi:hypothetical protein
LKYDATKFLNAYDTICIMITWGMAIIHIYVPLVLIWFPDHDDDNCTVLVKWLIYWLISYTDNILLVVSFDQLLMNALLYAHFYSYHWIALYKNPSGTYLCMLHKFLAIWQSLNISNNSSTLQYLKPFSFKQNLSPPYIVGGSSFWPYLIHLPAISSQSTKYIFWSN